MSQSYVPPLGTDKANTWRAAVNNMDDALLTKFSGAAAPTGAEVKAFQWWADTSGSPVVLNIRNALNTAWVPFANIDAVTGVGTILSDGTVAMAADLNVDGNNLLNLGTATVVTNVMGVTQLDASYGAQAVHLAAITATTTEAFFIAKSGLTIEKVNLVTNNTTISDGSNNWTFQIENVTQTLNLLASAKTTDGAEITADTAYPVIADQNQTIVTGDVLRIIMTKTGAPVDLTGYVLLETEYKII